MKHPQPEKPAGKAGRLAREAAALRANLLKRKEQVRRREAGKETTKTGAS